jgi:hypothetical protein
VPVPVPKISRKHLKEQSLEQGFVIQRAAAAQIRTCVCRNGLQHTVRSAGVGGQPNTFGCAKIPSMPRVPELPRNPPRT